MNEDCSKIGCAVPKNAVRNYLNQYSLNQVIVTNEEFTAVINGVTYRIPAGTFSLPITGDTSFPLTYQGCQSVVSVNVPPGSTIGQIQALAQSLLQQVAAQQAQCDAERANPVPPTPSFLNQQVSVASECTDPPLVINASLPFGIAQSGNSLVCAAGIFSSNVSQSDANQQAENFLANVLTALFSSGKATCSNCPAAGEFDGEITNSSPDDPCKGPGYKSDPYPITVPGGKNVQIVMTSPDFTPDMVTSGGLPDSKDQCAYGPYGPGPIVIDADASFVLNAGTANAADRGMYHLVITCVECVGGVESISDLTWVVNGDSDAGWSAIGAGATPGMIYAGVDPTTYVRIDSIPLKVNEPYDITVAISGNASISSVAVSAGKSFFYNKFDSPPLSTTFTLVKGCYILSLYASTANVGGSVSAVIS